MMPADSMGQALVGWLVFIAAWLLVIVVKGKIRGEW